MKPVLRYIGGKYSYGKILDDMGLIPEKINKYAEPFAGGLGMMVYLSNKRPMIKTYLANDMDPLLMNFYRWLSVHPDKFLIDYKINKKIHGIHKHRLNNFKRSLEDAVSYFIVKNTSYNSVISRNKDGLIKAYYSASNSTNSVLYNHKAIMEFSEFLKKVNLYQKHYKSILPKNSFVFLDPPYLLPHIKTYYSIYDVNLDDIFRYFKILHQRGNRIILLINYHKDIETKFKMFNVRVLKKGARHLKGDKKSELKELIITNYW
jgi:DNA adenine methylase